MNTSEDVQPNEMRLARKGISSVPAVRVSRPASSAHRAQSAVSLHSSGRNRTVSGSRASRSVHRRLPRKGSELQCARPRPLDAGKSLKRSRMQDPDVFMSNAVQSSSMHSTNDSSQSGKSSNADTFTMCFDLPPHCRKGAPLCHHYRRGWFQQQVRAIENAGARVVGHQYIDTAVHFHCSSLDIHDTPESQAALRGNPAILDSNEPPALSMSTVHALSLEAPTFAGMGGPAIQSGEALRRKDATRDNLVNNIQKFDHVRRTTASHHKTSLAGQKRSFDGSVAKSWRDQRQDGYTIPPKAPSSGRYEDAKGPTSSLQQSRGQKHLAAPLSLHRAPPIDASAALEGPSSKGHQSGTAFSPHCLEVPMDGSRSKSGLAPSHPGSSNSRRHVFRSGTLILAPSVASPLDAIRASRLEHSAPRVSSSAAERDATDDSTHFQCTITAPADADSVNGRPGPAARDLSMSSCPDALTQAQHVLTTGSLLASVSGPNVEQVVNGTRGHRALHLGLVEEIVQLERGTYDKPRRLLISPALGLLSITLQGAVDRIERVLPRQKHVLLSANGDSRHAVDDACLLRATNHDVILLGHARDEGQLSLVKLDGEKVNGVCMFDRPVQGNKREGISAVCSMLQPFGFATGGYDHRIHIWDVKDDMSMPSPTGLPVKHSSMVQSLLPIHDTSHKLVSAGADCTVHFWDLSSERVVNTLKTSNAVYHVHEVLSPFCTLLEIAHRELQFEIRDHRMAPVLPVQRFGYAAPRFQFHGRYVKGDIHLNTFTCGDRSGTVRLWDLRNVSKCSNTVRCFFDRRITQVIYDDEYLVACSEDHELAFITHTSHEEITAVQTNDARPF